MPKVKKSLRTVLQLQVVAALMDCLASDKRYKDWSNKYAEGLGGMVGVYQLVIEWALLAVQLELRYDVLDRLYEISEALSDAMLRDPYKPKSELTSLITSALCIPEEKGGIHVQARV